jgi:iron(III) transport system substrate-binding protein
MFVDYMTGKNVQTYIAKVLNRRSVRNDVGIKPYLVSKDSIKEIRVDYKTAGGLKNDWLARFAEIWNSLQ